MTGVRSLDCHASLAMTDVRSVDCHASLAMTDVRSVDCHASLRSLAMTKEGKWLFWGSGQVCDFCREVGKRSGQGCDFCRKVGKGEEWRRKIRILFFFLDIPWLQLQDFVQWGFTSFPMDCMQRFWMSLWHSSKKERLRNLALRLRIWRRLKGWWVSSM